jgi:hypothetical protein
VVTRLLPFFRGHGHDLIGLQALLNGLYLVEENVKGETIRFLSINLEDKFDSLLDQLIERYDRQQ